MNIENLLDEQIEKSMKELDNFEVGSEEYDKAVTSISKLMDRSIEITKAQNELDVKMDIETAKLEQEKEESKKERWIKIAGIAVPTGLTIWGTLKTFNFEKTGTVCSPIGRKFIDKLINFRR